MAVKEGTVAFEETTPYNRLFDLDVLIKEGETAHSLSRGELNLPVRTCLICGRSRRHTVAGLQERVAVLIKQAIQAN
ncbi:hypothetical protein HCZ84_08925 [Limosilactobacillus fermentum]